MKNKMIILCFCCLFSFIFLVGCLHREMASFVDPKLPSGDYYVRYYEFCGMAAQCRNQFNKESLLKYSEYYMTFEKSDLRLVLAYKYRNQELTRKIFYYYDNIGNLIKSEYTDTADVVLSYNIYEYDEKRNLIKITEYLLGDIIYRITKYTYEEFDRLRIIDIKDYSEKDFVKRQYVVIEYDAEGNITKQTDYDTYYLVFKPSIGEATKDFLRRFFMKDPDIMEHKLVNEKEGEFSGYTILHITTSPKVIAEKVLVSLDFVGEIRDTKEIKYSKNIITFIR